MHVILNQKYLFSLYTLNFYVDYECLTENQNYKNIDSTNKSLYQKII